ncbi:hypothetical protein [Nodularia sp. NIES-3585]|uniref:hypothetical protein n=1 Tax=Nodularia sp. NIES-3585 TaxID=1973477 RepID=UPI0011317551|nr:hypothetical protein [Nodularia sp. NIES-3585]
MIQIHTYNQQNPKFNYKPSDHILIGHCQRDIYGKLRAIAWAFVIIEDMTNDRDVIKKSS